MLPAWTARDGFDVSSSPWAAFLFIRMKNIQKLMAHFLRTIIWGNIKTYVTKKIIDTVKVGYPDLLQEYSTRSGNPKVRANRGKFTLFPQNWKVGKSESAS